MGTSQLESVLLPALTKLIHELEKPKVQKLIACKSYQELEEANLLPAVLDSILGKFFSVSL